MTDSGDVVADLASWSPWVPFATGRADAPRLPGVYMVRERTTGLVVYVGKAGLRDRGGKGTPKGLHGRLQVYARGRGAVSGLGMACLDRALSDPAWLRERLNEVDAGTPRDALGWAALAVERADLELRWATTASAADAGTLEKKVLFALASAGVLWNRLMPRHATPVTSQPPPAGPADVE